jgi:hypothetical protein
MGDFLLEMEWHVCVDGYDLVPRGIGSRYSDLLEPRSKSVRFYKPFQKYELLYLAFAQLKTKDDLLGFINRFGLLSGRSVNIEKELRDAKAFHDLIIAKQVSNRKVWNTFRRRTALDYAEYLDKRGETVDLPALMEEELPIRIGRINLVPDRNEGMRLHIGPYSLIQGLWVQLARKLSQKQ